jgi:hypothetical protein
MFKVGDRVVFKDTSDYGTFGILDSTWDEAMKAKFLTIQYIEDHPDHGLIVRFKEANCYWKARWFKSCGNEQLEFNFDA